MHKIQVVLKASAEFNTMRLMARLFEVSLGIAHVQRACSDIAAGQQIKDLQARTSSLWSFDC